MKYLNQIPKWCSDASPTKTANTYCFNLELLDDIGKHSNEFCIPFD